MANLTETPAWVNGIYQLETSDPVLGGPEGIDNLQAKQLANRTGFLKKQIDDAVSGALTVMYANKLKTPRSISMTGDGTWTTSFDGSSNITAAMTLSNSGITPGIYKSVTVDAKGRITAGSNPTTMAGYGITDGLSTSNYTAADILAKIKTVDGTGSGLDADLLDGKDSPYFLDLANSTGTLPSARLTGTYTGITLKNGSGNSIIGDGGSAARTVTDLVQYRGPASITGAIVFLAPAGLNSVMHMMHILGFDYTSSPKNVECIVQGYRTTAAWSHQHLTHNGAHKPTIRLARKISTNQSAFIIGDVDNAWAYPHFSIRQALFGHSGATDAYCAGWNSEVITALTDYDNLITVSDTPSTTSMPWSQITGVPSTLPNQNISGNAGTATTLATSRTISLTGDATGSATFDGSANASMAVTVSGLKTAAPAGMTGFFASTTAPNGWLKANGSAVSRTTYAALFAVVGTTFGIGDGSTTFNLPDLRGEFIRAFDDGRGVDSGRAFGSTQGTQNATHTHTASAALAGDHAHTLVVPYAVGARIFDNGPGSGYGSENG
ncbi:MAG: phage tail protein, partial [Azovibrio sp.]